MSKLIYIMDWLQSGEHFICPTSFDEIKRVAHILLYRKNVSIDLSRLSAEDRVRVLYFLSGISYAINGKITQITNLKYMFSTSHDNHLQEIKQV